MQKAYWIWLNNENNADEYVRFYDTFYCEQDGAKIALSCDSNYILYINGNLAAFGQYADFPHYKVYDEIDISEYLVKGKNVISVLVWYYGQDSQCYMKASAGLIYEITSSDEVIAYSNENVLCRLADDYINHRKKNITDQLGLSFSYKAACDDGFGRLGYLPSGFSYAVQIDKPYTLYKRPNKKLLLKPVIHAALIDEKRRIYDLGEEKAGFLNICFKTEKGARVTVVFGEHTAAKDGLLRFYDAQDYSIELFGNGEMYEYVNYFRRFGCRYFQIFSEKETEIDFIGMRETPYPISIQPFETDSELKKRIYDVSVRTLVLCMHEHYEDCPWREQVLYPLDSRNQMLCGYVAFKEYEFARSNLLLMSKAPRLNGLLPACMPSGIKIIIPFYNLIYIMQMREYASFSSDTSLIREYLWLMEDIISLFLRNTGESGLVREFENCWNFYEWSDSLDGRNEKSGKLYSLPLNCFAILAMQNANEIYRMLSIDKNYNAEISKLQQAVYQNFYDSEKGLFISFLNRKHYSKLCNSLALLSDCAKSDAGKIAKKIIEVQNSCGLMTETSLAMKIFEYDALLKVNEKYIDVIIKEIERSYGYMLKKGATAFWETIDGEKQYGGAGSLCHGWSAIPVIYLTLKKG